MGSITLANPVSIGNPITGSSGSFTVTSSTGNLLICAIGGSSASNTITGITDNKLNTWLPVDNNATDVTAGPSRIFYVKNAITGVTTLQVTVSPASNFLSMVFYDCAGADSNAPLEAHAILSSQPATTNPVGPSITPTTNGGIVVVVLATATTATAVAAPFTPADIINGTSTGDGIAHNLYAAATNFNPSWTQTSGTWDASIAAFKPQVAGGHLLSSLGVGG
jgi:hypothetical protein